MNRIPRIRRIAATLAGLTLLCLGLATAAPAAFAMIVPPPGGPAGATATSGTVTVTRTVVVGGMPGWQIALIAAGTAVVAAILAVLADRVHAAHRKTALPAA